MRTFVPVLLALAALAAPAASAIDPGPFVCAPYAFATDEPMRYLCAEPGDASCPVYTRTYNGVSWGPKECLDDAVAFADQCVFVGQDLDYEYYGCVAPGDPSCPVYSLRRSGGHEVKTCHV